jgi:hypothetical protein
MSIGELRAFYGNALNDKKLLFGESRRLDVSENRS